MTGRLVYTYERLPADTERFLAMTDDPGLPTFDPVDGEDDPVPPDDGEVTVPAQPDEPEDQEDAP